MDTQAASNKPKQKKKIIIKIICVVLAFLLTLGMDFIVANIVHKNNPLPASAEIKNGLSAYELAVEQGYKGNLDDWLKSLDGKSAFEIAVENGYTGTEAEWNKAVANVANQNSVAITNAEFSSNGELIITLSDGTDINVGKVAGSDGKDGANGKNGTNGKDGKNGTNGVNGKDGIDGKDGVNGTNGIDGKDGNGISSASINEADQLILVFSDGSTVNLDKIVGTNGVDGKNGLDGKDGRDGINGAKSDKGDKGDKGTDGKDGKDGTNGIDGTDGIGISSIVITEDGELDITLSNGTTLNLGTIKGADGKDGRDGRDGIDGVNGVDGKDGLNGTDGRDGQDGIGISNVNINDAGELVLTFSDNQTINLGRIVGKDGKDGMNGIDGVNGKDGINGTNGIDGNDGKDGIGIKNVTVSDEGVLTVILDNDTVLNLGNIKGADGKNGADGADGKDGDDGLSAYEIAKKYGKTNATSEEEWLEEFKAELKGEKGDTGAQGDPGAKGDTGAQGEKGEDGRGISKTELVNGELIIYYTDGGSANLGSVSGSDMSNNILEFILLDDDTYGVKAGGAAKNCKTIEIPEMHNEKEVTQILSNGFSSLTSLTSISIPQTITTIGDLAFYNCPALESISFPNSLQKIGRMSFSNCYSITSVTIPQSVKYIGKYAFYQSGILQVTFEVTDNWLCGGAPLEYTYTSTPASGSTSTSTRTYSLSDEKNAANALRGPVEIAVGSRQFAPLGGGSVTIYNYSEQNWFELDWTHA